MTNTIPQGRWLEAEAFRELVREIVPLRLGGWSLREFERATSALGWELGEPDDVAGQIRRHFLPGKGPWGGYGSVTTDPAEPERIRELRVSVVDLFSEDVRAAADEVRAAWWIMEEEVGPPTLWGGRSGPWMLWRLPGGSLIVHSQEGLMDLELVPAGAAPDVTAPRTPRSLWRAAETDHLPPALAAPAAPGTHWDDAQERLAQALRSLNEDTPFFPGRFILHLGSAHDPHRFVQCWSDGPDLVIEATAYAHHPELADPARLAENGWALSHSLWQRRFPHAMKNSACATTAAHMLVGELRNLDITLADLVYSGTMTGRGHGFQLDLPEVGLRRSP